jgi:hypothetical protein
MEPLKKIFFAIFSPHFPVKGFGPLIQGTLERKYHCTVDLLFDWFGISCMTSDDFCFYLQNRFILTGQTEGQLQSETSPLSVSWLILWLRVECSTTVIQSSNFSLEFFINYSLPVPQRNSSTVIQSHAFSSENFFHYLVSLPVPADRFEPLIIGVWVRWTTTVL